MYVASTLQASGTGSELMSKSGCRTASARAPLGTPTLNTSRRNVPLARGQAATFTPREDTRLRLVEGRLWITFEAPPSGLAPRNGDHFVEVGECFDLLAGESAVLEPVGSAPVALFDLEPALTLPWRAAGQQVLANLRPAVARVAGAGRRLFGSAVDERQRC